MRTKINLLIIILISSLIISCSEDMTGGNNPVTISPSQENNFRYPYDLNSFWYYTTRNFVTNLRPDSIITYYDTDTTFGVGGAVFVKDTIISSDTLRLLSNSHSESGHAHLTLEYFKQTDSGLIRIASYSEGASFGPFSTNEVNNKYEVNGQTYHSIRDLLDNYEYENFSNAKLVFDDPPVTTLKYPIVQGLEWHLLSNGDTEIRKQYTDFETVTVRAGTFYCNKVKRNWYYNSVGPDPKIILYDYFSKDGMIKRDLIIKDILVFNSSGPIGYLDVKEEIELNIYTHP